MYMSLIALFLMLGIGYYWASKGFFSALLNLGAVVASGAIALALWEPIAYALIDKADGYMVQDIVWGLSLVLPFAVCMAVLSLTLRYTVKASLKPATVFDWVGGAICGLGAGLLASGLIVISVGYVRISPDFLGYRAVGYDAQGSICRTGEGAGALWFPVDRLTAQFYGFTSERSMATGRPLAAWRPHLADEAHLYRVSEEENLGRFHLRPADVVLGGRYTVGAKGNEKLNDLIGDPGNPKNVLNLEGEKMSGTSSLEGYIVLFKAGAKEKNGQVMVGAGSTTLVLRSPDDEESMTLQPIACISQAKGGSLDIGRWRFDSRNMFIPSVGGGSDAAFAFEFLVPKRSDGDWKPTALYVKGVRFDLTDENGETIKPAVAFERVADREAVRESGEMFRSINSAAASMGTGTISKFDDKVSGGALRLTKMIPEGIVLDGSTISGIDLQDGNKIRTCTDLRLSVSALATTGIDRSLRIDSFVPGEGTSIVTIDVSNASEFAMNKEPSSSATGAPSFYDSLGQRYDAIGYVYKDRTEIRIRFTPGSPLTSFADAPAVSRARDDQKLHLIFRISTGVKIQKYAVGEMPVATFQPEPTVPDQASR